ncbi:prohead protease/major capsid protein fusion protein [Rhizorhabdus histidinilytica]|uniref:prohead protease/major capsid protein fusion protein n=1 Tax=Rhizorhabdus histidinilytica TaxID=439228 RepID=UPI00321F924E
MPTSTTAVPAAEETRANIAMVTRDAAIRPNSFNAEQNTVDVCWTTGARGARFDWLRWQMVDEELATDASNVRLDRLNAGAAVLNTHGQYDLDQQIGVVVDGTARMENGEGIATVRLSRREELAPIVADIADGIIRNLSVGYRVHTYEITETEGERPLYRAVDWEPYEISFVPVPFDAGAQVRSGHAAQGGYPCIIRRTSASEENEMPTATQQPAGDPADQTRGAPSTTVAPAAPAVPVTDPAAQVRAATQPAAPAAPTVAAVTVAAIRSAVTNAGLADAVAFELIERHEATPLTNDALMADIGRRFAERDQSGGVRTVNRVPAQAGNNVTIVRAMEDAVFHRMSPGSQLSDAGRNFRGMSMLRMAEELLGSSGISMRGMSAHEIAERALHSTSDFPALMGSALGRRLRAAYEENNPTYRQWARRAPNAPDFRLQDVVQLSAMPDLLKVGEGGEVKSGTFSDGKVSYGVISYGRVIGLTRQLIINDDLRALERITTGFAGSAARLENRTVYGQITGNPTMAYDGKALFHTDHGNLAGSGAAIAQATLSAGRARMRKQKGLQNEKLNLAPAFLLVPTDLEQVAYQFTSSQYVPAKPGDTNEFRQGGRTAIEPIVEPELDDSSATAWYLAANSAQTDTVEYTYLEGAEGVQMSSRVGFTVDGVELKAMLDFAAAVIDHRGLDKNPGA